MADDIRINKKVKDYYFVVFVRFSQFFVSPLVKKEAMEREVHAVDSGICYSHSSVWFLVLSF